MKRVLQNNKQAFTIAGFKKFSGKLFLKKISFLKEKISGESDCKKIVGNYA